MLFAIFLAAMTFASSFMAADTVAYVLEFRKDRIAVLFFALWACAVTLTVMEMDWLPFLGSTHIVVFAICTALAYMAEGLECLKRDYIYYPLYTFVPLFILSQLL